MKLEHFHTILSHGRMGKVVRVFFGRGSRERDTDPGSPTGVSEIAENALAESKNVQGRLSLLIAAIAVLLSQFPPVYQWFHAPELEIKTGQAFSIAPNPYYGLSVSKYYSVTNIGEKHGRIKSIYLYIADMEGNILYETRGQSYRTRVVQQFNEARWEEFTEIRSGLKNRKGAAFAQDRRPPERLSGIYETASRGHLINIFLRGL